ncbi:MAG: RNA polymerase sigma factor [bacterium]|jgi:RNA polymerase sigma-70 factor (ECF subfamily)
MVQIPTSLVLACADRDERAWRELIKLTTTPLMGLARRYLSSETLAEDALQEAYIKVWRNIGSLRDASKAYSWMASIVVNECRQSWNRNKKHIGTDLEDVEYSLGEAGEHEAEMKGRERSEIVQAALKKLPPKLREILILREFQDMEYDEIARAAGIPVGTVRSRLARAREKWIEIVKGLVPGGDLLSLASD